MRGRLWIPVLVFLAGVACIAVAAATGEAQVQLFIIFPVISGTSLLFILGVFLIVASFVLGFIFLADSMSEYESAQPDRPINDKARQEVTSPQKRTRYGGVVLIGPVPIIFGSDRRMTWVMVVLAVVLIAVVLSIAFFSVQK